MTLEAVLHNSTREFVYIVKENCFVFKIRTKRDDCLAVNLYYQDKYGHVIKNTDYRVLPMTKIASDELFDYYEALLETDYIVVKYSFELVFADEQLKYYSNYHFYDDYEEVLSDDSNKFYVPLQARREDKPMDIEWMREGIMYQIFPDRFNKSPNSQAKHTGSPYLKDTAWDASPAWNSNFGGNLKGITEKLDYLKDLGITIIYLTPIFKSESNHKYNTADYYKLDESFGTEEEFRELVSGIHERNMKIILDGVFNHSGNDFAPFLDVLEKGELSEFKDWFLIDSFPVKRIENGRAKPNYYSFSYFSAMPKLNTENPAVREYILGIIDYWMDTFNIDGWRLDVADEVSHVFWSEFCSRVHSHKKDAPIIGEVWYDSRDFLIGNEFTSVMNYQFFYSVNRFIAASAISASQFVNECSFVRGTINRNAFGTMLNLIDSHDSPRFLTAGGNDKRKQKLAALLQLTFTGTPMIYYGDEIAMQGGKDPDCRRGMIWDENKMDLNMHSYYKALISLRKKYKSLYMGEFETVYTDDDKNILIYKKVLGAETLFIAINNSEESVEITGLKDKINLINGETMTTTLPPFMGVIFA